MSLLLIAIPVLILVFLTILSMLAGNDFVSSSLDASETYQSFINGSATGVGIDGSESLGVDPLLFAIIWITIIGAIAVASAVNALGSGLTDRGSHWLTYMVFFVSFWIILSTFPFPMILSIEIVGSIIYLFLTICYAVGVILFIGGSG